MDRPLPASRVGGTCVVGVLRGEGIGPEVIDAALVVLRAVASYSSAQFDLRFGGAIGQEAERLSGQALSEEVITFCREVFAANGAVLAGPGGGRFVYDLRRTFDLFCKINPIVVSQELNQQPAPPDGSQPPNIDIVVVRENLGGVYQGEWDETVSSDHERIAHHRLTYRQTQVTRILGVAARIAQQRKAALTVVTKIAGLPSISRLWHDCAAKIADEAEVAWSVAEIDYAAYLMVQHPQQLEVVVTPNLFGDILSDLGGVLLGSRGLCFGGNFASDGTAVYQTNHGGARDLAGADRANPVGQIFSLAMMLRESFGLTAEAAWIERAVRDVWRAGWGTADFPRRAAGALGIKILGTKAFAKRVAEAVTQIATLDVQSA